MKGTTASTRRRCMPAICADIRGAILMSTLVLITVLAVLGATAITTTTTETKISGHFLTATQAFFVAEAGIQHTVGILNNPGGASNGFNDELTTSGGVMLNTFALNGGAYTVTVTDNNDDADLNTDSDNTIVLTSLGTQSGARQTTQVVVTRAPIQLKGLITQDNLQIPGDAVVSGSCGNVHSNSNMVISGNPTIDQNCSASGTVTVSGSPTVNGTMTDGAPEVPIPLIDPAAHAGYADYQLRADGIVYDADGNLIANGPQLRDGVGLGTWSQGPTRHDCGFDFADPGAGA